MNDRVPLTPRKEKALALARANRLHEARPLFEGICRLGGSDAESWYMLGAINGQLGLHDEAVACLQKAVSLQPSPEAYDNLVNALQHQERLDEAIADYRQYERLMAHWRGVLTLPMFEIRYEDLVADQETWTRRLVEFCALPWDEHCLRFHESRRIVNTASYAQVRRPLYQSSVGRWRHYDPYLHELRETPAHEP